MPNNPSELQAHIETVTGHEPSFGPPPEGVSSKLPLFIRERYTLSEGRLFGRGFLIAAEDETTEPATPKEYASHLATLQSRSPLPVVLVIHELPARTRNRLVQEGIPFIVPGRQMFLPILFVDLRERFPRATTASAAALSAPAQVLILYHLVKDRLDAMPLREIATLLRYSAMMITKAKDELVAVGLCESHQEGRTVHLLFPKERRELWEVALPKLLTPIRETTWMRWGAGEKPKLVLSGVSALARQTVLSDDELPSLAAQRSVFKTALRTNQMVPCEWAEDANARVEVWRYDPELLATDGVVDPLSLYLCLRDSPDDRVQHALGTLLEGFPW